MKQEQAQVYALKALEWMAGQDDLLMIFLGQSGADLGDITNSAASAEMQGAVLDFILQADEHVLALSEHIGEPPETILKARHALPGGDLPHWT